MFSALGSEKQVTGESESTARVMLLTETTSHVRSGIARLSHLKRRRTTGGGYDVA